MPHSYKPNKSYIDKSLNKAELSPADYKKEYTLSIQFSLDGFSFSVMEEENHKQLALEDYSFPEFSDELELCVELDALVRQLDILKRRYRRVNLVFESPKTTIVPAALFNEDDAEKLLKFNHRLEYYEKALYDYLPNMDAYLIYACPTCITDVIKARFINYKQRSHISSLIESLLILHKNQSPDHQVFLNFRKKHFDILYIQDNELKFFNTYKHNTIEDFAYFLLYVYQQLNLNPEEIELVFTGNIDKTSPYFEIAYKYIRNIHLMERNEHFRYSYVFDDIPSQAYFTLLNTRMCES